MKVKKVSKPTLHCDTYLIAQAVNHNAEVLEDVLNRIKELEKRLAQEDAAENPLKIEEFAQQEDMTREQAINLIDNLIGMVEDNHNSDYDIALQMAKKAIEQEPFKGAYIQVAKERDIAIEQLRELGYSLGEKIRPCEKEQEPIIGEVRAEIEKQEEWLAQAGYNAYNVCMAFGSIKRALRKLGVLNDGIRRNG